MPPQAVGGHAGHPGGTGIRPPAADYLDRLPRPRWLQGRGRARPAAYRAGVPVLLSRDLVHDWVRRHRPGHELGSAGQHFRADADPGHFPDPADRHHARGLGRADQAWLADRPLEEANRAGLAGVTGDATRREVLIKAEIGLAAWLVIAVARDDSAVLIALTARQLNRDLVIVAAVRSRRTSRCCARAAPITWPGRLSGRSTPRSGSCRRRHPRRMPRPPRAARPKRWRSA